MGVFNTVHMRELSAPHVSDNYFSLMSQLDQVCDVFTLPANLQNLGTEEFTIVS